MDKNIFTGKFNATKSQIRLAISDYLRICDFRDNRQAQATILWTSENDRDEQAACLSWIWTLENSPPFSGGMTFVRIGNLSSDQYIGDIFLTERMPVNVSIICRYELANEFFESMVNHLWVYLPTVRNAGKLGIGPVRPGGLSEEEKQERHFNAKRIRAEAKVLGRSIKTHCQLVGTPYTTLREWEKFFDD